MLKIYHVKGTRSLRPIWLCYELDLPVTIEPIDFSPSYRNSPAWRAISPAGKVPAMIDGDLTMFESGAMVDYILERYGQGRLRPAPGAPQSALHHQWCWFSEATLVRPLGLMRMMRYKSDRPEPVAADAEIKVRDCLEVIDQAVSASDFLLGSEFGAADIMMGYSLQLIAKIKLLDEQYPNAQAYLERLESREAFKRAQRA